MWLPYREGRDGWLSLLLHHIGSTYDSDEYFSSYQLPWPPIARTVTRIKLLVGSFDTEIVLIVILSSQTILCISSSFELPHDLVKLHQPLVSSHLYLLKLRFHPWLDHISATVALICWFSLKISRNKVFKDPCSSHLSSQKEVLLPLPNLILQFPLSFGHWFLMALQRACSLEANLHSHFII